MIIFYVEQSDVNVKPTEVTKGIFFNLKFRIAIFPVYLQFIHKRCISCREEDSFPRILLISSSLGSRAWQVIPGSP